MDHDVTIGSAIVRVPEMNFGAPTMKTRNSSILTVNSGSSSIKFALFEDSASLGRIVAGTIERIGLPGSTLRVRDPAKSGVSSRPIIADHHGAAANALLDCIGEYLGGQAPAAAGHRVVYGGSEHSDPELVTEDLVDDLRHLTSFDPEHMPGAVLMIETISRRFRFLPQVLCFDTAFHRELPRVAQILPIPRKYEARGLRRWGFHGLSYEFLMSELARLAGTRAAHGRVILAHLGSGASLAAVSGGKSLDTSMGFSPASGVPMGTRSGDIDPGLVGYMARAEGLDAQRFHDMVNLQSGLLGVSETSPDMRDLLACEAQDPRAAEAVALFCYQVKKCIGSMSAVLGGLDTLVFAGGIGENEAAVRARICEGMGFLGIRLDEKRNAANKSVLSAAKSRVSVRLIRTDEELMIARSVRRMLKIA